MSNEQSRHGYFGDFGGQFMPETLMNAVIELEEAYNTSKDSEATNSYCLSSFVSW